MVAECSRRAFVAVAGRAAIGGLLWPLAGCSTGAPPAAATSDRALEALVQELEGRIPTLLRDARVPGLSMAILRDASVAWRRGFGIADHASKAPVTVDTVFEAGSTSKPVFAYAVLKLCERGILGLDTPLSSYKAAPWVTGDSSAALITPRHVLSHTSGLPNWRSADDPLRVRFAPGSQWSYSGEGYSYLQSVVTHLTGRVDRSACSRYEQNFEVCATDIGAFMRDRVLQPFGMARSGYVWNDTLASDWAQPVDEANAPLERPRPTATDAARYAAAGGLLTTPGDYAKFIAELLAPKPADEVRIGAASLTEMMTPQIPAPEENGVMASWGLGWQLQQRPRGVVFAHGGYNPGYHSYVAASREQRSGVVVMTNADHAYPVIQTLVLQELDRLLGMA
jgi:CubicO group peptidase (beta-lactamase class C family)